MKPTISWSTPLIYVQVLTSLKKVKPKFFPTEIYQPLIGLLALKQHRNTATSSSTWQLYNFLKACITFLWSIFLSRPNILSSICWGVHSLVSKIRQVEFTQSSCKVWQGRNKEIIVCSTFYYSHLKYCKSSKNMCCLILIIIYFLDLFIIPYI